MTRGERKALAESLYENSVETFVSLTNVPRAQSHQLDSNLGLLAEKSDGLLLDAVDR